MKIGSLEWERANGPPLTVPQRLAVLAAAGRVLIAHFVARWGRPAKVDLSAWAPPDSSVAREAEAFMREVSTPYMVNHSVRTYWFAAVMYELSARKPPIDREALYVAALLHDVGFREPRPGGDGCFTIASAREARRITATWPEARRDLVASAITANPSPNVPLAMGAEAHFMSTGAAWRCSLSGGGSIPRTPPRSWPGRRVTASRATAPHTYGGRRSSIRAAASPA